MNPAEGWAAVSPLPYAPEHVAGLVEAEARDTLTNYRNGWHALAACHLNPDDPWDWFRLAAGSQEMAASWPTITNRAFALTVAKMICDVSGGALWLN